MAVALAMAMAQAMAVAMARAVALAMAMAMAMARALARAVAQALALAMALAIVVARAVAQALALAMTMAAACEPYKDTGEWVSWGGGIECGYSSAACVGCNTPMIMRAAVALIVVESFAGRRKKFTTDILKCGWYRRRAKMPTKKPDPCKCGGEAEKIKAELGGWVAIRCTKCGANSGDHMSACAATWAWKIKNIVEKETGNECA
jgi:hypothetical protein